MPVLPQKSGSCRCFGNFRRSVLGQAYACLRAADLKKLTPVENSNVAISILERDYIVKK